MYFHCCLLWKEHLNLDYQVNHTTEPFVEEAIVAQDEEGTIVTDFPSYDDIRKANNP